MSLGQSGRLVLTGGLRWQGPAPSSGAAFLSPLAAEVTAQPGLHSGAAQELLAQPQLHPQVLQVLPRCIINIACYTLVCIIHQIKHIQMEFKQ